MLFLPLKGDQRQNAVGEEIWVGTMKHTIDVSYRGRKLEIRAVIVAGDWQIWVSENGRRVYLYSVLPYGQSHELEDALMQAKRDLEAEAIVVPIVRMWPPERKSEQDPLLSG